MSDYPNIDAIAHGNISGRFSEWPRVRPEAKAILARIESLEDELAAANKQTIEQHRIVQDLGRELRAANERAERVLWIVEDIAPGDPDDGRIPYDSLVPHYQMGRRIREALRPAPAQEPCGDSHAHFAKVANCPCSCHTTAQHAQIDTNDGDACSCGWKSEARSWRAHAAKARRRGETTRDLYPPMVKISRTDLELSRSAHCASPEACPVCRAAQEPKPLPLGHPYESVRPGAIAPEKWVCAKCGQPEAAHKPKEEAWTLECPPGFGAAQEPKP